MFIRKEKHTLNKIRTLTVFMVSNIVFFWLFFLKYCTHIILENNQKHCILIKWFCTDKPNQHTQIYTHTGTYLHLNVLGNSVYGKFGDLYIVLHTKLFYLRNIDEQSKSLVWYGQMKHQLFKFFLSYTMSSKQNPQYTNTLYGTLKPVKLH